MKEGTVVKSPSSENRSGKIDLRLLEEVFWQGYRHGLNRHLHGNIFNYREGQYSWDELPDNLDDAPYIWRISGGKGYRAGSAGLSIEGAADTFREFAAAVKLRQKV